MNFDEAKNKLTSLGEPQLLENWGCLNQVNQKILLNQIANLNADELKKQKEFLKAYQAISKKEKNFTPFANYQNVESEYSKDFGQKLLSQGKAGCLIVAGGQGSRLGFDGPKGMFPISGVLNKTLFQIFAEKTLAAGKLAGRLLQIAIMTSPQNHEETLNFFKRNNNFGLLDEQINFFSQNELPILDDEGHLILDKNNLIAQGPDGNGSSLLCFAKKGILNKWKQMGIEYVNFLPIDNPLADPYDASLIGFHASQKAEITIKSIPRDDPTESVGVIVTTDEGVRVIEYSEMHLSEKIARLPSGILKHRCTNISLFCFDLSFIERVANHQTLSWHLAYKTCGFGEKKGWKFETFIFDFLAYSKKVSVLMYPRNLCFAPLKQSEGNDSPETVKKALREYDKKALEEITGQQIKNDEGDIELHQEFHYPNKNLLKKWKSISPPEKGYISP